MAQQNDPELPKTKPTPFSAPRPAPGPAPAPEATRAQLWTFWLGVAAALIVARVLDAMLPGIHESVIERWVMLGFGAFLIIFLIKLE